MSFGIQLAPRNFPENKVDPNVLLRRPIVSATVSVMKASLDKVALIITEDVPLGSRLIHFWHTDAEKRANNAET